MRPTAERSFPARPEAVRRGVHRSVGHHQRREAWPVHPCAAAVPLEFRQQVAFPPELRPAVARFESAAPQAPAGRPKGAAAAEAARRSAVSGQRARALLREEAAVLRAQAAPRQAVAAAGYGPAAAEVAAPDAQVLPPEVAAGPDARPAAVAAVPDAQQAVAEEPDAQRVAGAAAEPDAGAVLRPGAQDAPVRRPAAARPSTALSACRRGQLPGLAQRGVARFAHVMRKSRAASPSGLWWQAARCEGLS